MLAPLLIAATPIARERRLAAALTAADSPTMPFLPIQWLHVPKTGSTFGLSAYVHACTRLPHNVSLSGDGIPIMDLTVPYPPNKYCKGGFVNGTILDGHVPAQRSARGRLVSMFRNPLEHKISFLRFMYTFSERMDNSPFWYSMIGCTFASASVSERLIAKEMDRLNEATIKMGKVAAPDEAVNARCAFLQFVLPRLAGCQSKMLAGGIGCLSMSSDAPRVLDSARGVEVLALTPERVRDAVDELAFAGLKERWAESVCLFHRVLRTDTTKLAPWDVEFSDTRPTTAKKTLGEIDWITEATTCGIADLLLTDTLDEVLYNATTSRFEDALLNVHDADFARCLAQAPVGLYRN